MDCVYERILCVMVKPIVWMAVMKALLAVSNDLILQAQLELSKQSVDTNFWNECYYLLGLIKKQ